MNLSDLTEFGKLLMDIVKLISSVITKKNAVKPAAIDPAIMVELYGGLMRLSNLCQIIKSEIDSLRKLEKIMRDYCLVLPLIQ